MLRAIVKGSCLQCYEWDHEDKLTLICKVHNIDKEHGIFAYFAYNHDKETTAVVISDQIILFDDPTPLNNSAVVDIRSIRSIRIFKM